MTLYGKHWKDSASLKMPEHLKLKLLLADFFLLFLVSYAEERPWWPIQSPNKGSKKKAKGKEEREMDQVY